MPPSFRCFFLILPRRPRESFVAQVHDERPLVGSVPFASCSVSAWLARQGNLPGKSAKDKKPASLDRRHQAPVAVGLLASANWGSATVRRSTMVHLHCARSIVLSLDGGSGRKTWVKQHSWQR